MWLGNMPLCNLGHSHAAMELGKYLNAYLFVIKIIA